MRTLVLALALFAITTAASAQGRGGAPAAPPAPRVGAPIDLTGYWVAVISEDWRWRMVTPARGDVASIPLNPKGFADANAWDPARDTASRQLHGQMASEYARRARMMSRKGSADQAKP